MSISGSDEDFFDSVFACFEEHFPEACREYAPRLNLHRRLLCPERVSLPRSLADEATNVVRAFGEIRELKDRSARLEESSGSPAIPDPGNYSALMSYDFHVDEGGHLRLIEINTNASLSLVTDCLQTVQGVKNLFASDFRADILETFRKEAVLARKPKIQTVAIVDENPRAQKLYFEFLLYRDLFVKAGFNSVIADSNEIQFKNEGAYVRDQKVDLIYNRGTDFYFQSPSTAGLRAVMMSQAACISPHPHEYKLLADKERLLELSREGAVKSLPISGGAKATLERTLIKTRDLAEMGDSDAIWAARKKLFFKPKRSFGGKAVYRGASITRTAFAEILGEPYVAQDYVPAPTVQLSSAPEPFKYDLRFYAYRDRIQLGCARVYRGQTTNMQTPGGGVAVIDWK